MHTLFICRETRAACDVFPPTLVKVPSLIAIPLISFVEIWLRVNIIDSPVNAIPFAFSESSAIFPTAIPGLAGIELDVVQSHCDYYLYYFLILILIRSSLSQS